MQLENIKTLDYTNELADKTKALARTKKTGNQEACLELGRKWRQMGGAQDYLLGLFHSLARSLFQEAGYGCVKHPRAVAIAYEIRERCRSCLRNPDGYEVWPDYWSRVHSPIKLDVSISVPWLGWKPKDDEKRYN